MNKIIKIFTAFLILITLSATAFAGRLGPHLERIIQEGKGNFAGKKFGRTMHRMEKGKQLTLVNVFIEADPSAISSLRKLGAEINTITSSGIMTALVPVNRLRTIANTTGVHRVTAGKSVKKYMDISAGSTGVNLPNTAYPRPANTGQNVVVGVIDTGIDIEHPDFIDSLGNTRIVAIWDHTLDPGDVGNVVGSPTGFSYGTLWNSTIIQQGYSNCLHRDNDGHGTHVAGTAAGNGSASALDGPYTGLAPEAKLVIVKFDFDNEKNRNADTYILDGINWIYQQAAALGLPAVINMSLGSDYGPHDGSTAEERGIDDLTGANKLICISAGNAGGSYAGPSFPTYGSPIHGSGSSTTSNDFVFETAPGYSPGADDDYVFFDVWYPGSDTNRIQITTPSGLKYPPNFSGSYANLWVTDGTQGGFDTGEGLVYVSNVSAASSSWDSDNGDNNIYIEISDYYGTNPAAGEWKVEIIPLTGGDTYHAWHGFSDSMNTAYFWYDSGFASHTWGDTADPYLSDNVMTIGSPGSALSAISIGAYQTKNSWPAREYDDWENPSSPFILVYQQYNVPPLDYYNQFYMEDLAYFSSRGPSRDGRTQPFISAPGVGIIASLSQTTLNDPNEDYFRQLNRVEYNGFYAALQGTSMSSPHATGSVALLLEEAASQGLSPDPHDIKLFLQNGANKDSYTGLNPADLSDANNDWGFGKIDVTASLAQIQPPPLTIDTTSLDDGTVGSPYSQTLAASGGSTPYTWSVVSGLLPGGLSLNASTGEISGTPTTAETASFTVQVTDDDNATDTQALSITVDPASTSPTVISCVPDSGSRRQRFYVIVNGTNFDPGATVSFGSGIFVSRTTVLSDTQIRVYIRISRYTTSGPRDVIVTNPDSSFGILTDGFTVN